MVLPAAGVRSDLGWTEAVGRVLAHVRALLGFEMVVVSRRAGDDYVVLGASDVQYGVRGGDVLPWADTFCARMADGRAPAIVPDIDAVPAYLEAAELRQMDVGAYVSLPMRDTDGELLGTLCAATPHRQGPELLARYGELALLADLLAALLSAQLRLQREQRRSERAEQAADADPLTGLGNRRLWDRRLVAEEVRCASFGLPAGVVAVDLDGLKAVNDQLGHAAGDDLLRAAAGALCAVVGAHDAGERTVARIGGDEFVLLLPECDRDQVEATADAVRRALAARGLSAGVGWAARGVDGLAAAWRVADVALLADKRRPRPLLVQEPAALSSGTTGGGAADQLVEALLELARRQLGAAIAFVGEWQGGVRVMRGVSASTPVPVGRGSVEDLDATYCQRILDGRLPRVIPDTAAEPEAVGLPVTAAVPIGSYVGVPVVLPDGSLYGTLCCLSPAPDPVLSERDADLLDAVAQTLAGVLAAERRQRAADLATLTRLDPYLRSGPRIAYQPVVSLSDGAVVGVEALARFGHGADASPAAWFTAAAGVGLTGELELAAARAALAGAGGLPGFVALNLSATTVCSPGFATLLDGVDVARIVVEVSEHEQITDYGTVLDALRPWRDQGLRVAVDDAGAGFASLRHVVLLQPDIIKLDISLVRGIDRDPTRQALAAALTTFARSIGALVVAEGVETTRERSVLAGAGVGLMQGWLSGAPVPAAELRGRASVPAPRLRA